MSQLVVPLLLVRVSSLKVFVFFFCGSIMTWQYLNSYQFIEKDKPLILLSVKQSEITPTVCGVAGTYGRKEGLMFQTHLPSVDENMRKLSLEL